MDVFDYSVLAIVHLLKTVDENERREHEGEQHVLPVQPLDHLAKYLFRHNPRHSEPVRSSSVISSSLSQWY